MDAPPEKQFIDLVSPPLFLMMSILLAHAVEIALHQSSVTTVSDLARTLIASETNLLIFRAISWSFFPLLMASALLQRQARPVDRETLRRPFFLQCLFASPLVTGVSVANAFGRLSHPIVSAVIACATVAWYLGVQTLWFHTRLDVSRSRAFLLALSVFTLAVAIVLVIGVTIFGLTS